MLANHTAGVSLYLLFSLRKMAICGIINIIYFWNTQYTNIYIRRMKPISLTDIARRFEPDNPSYLIQSWLRGRNTD